MVKCVGTHGAMGLTCQRLCGVVGLICKRFESGFEGGFRRREGRKREEREERNSKRGEAHPQYWCVRPTTPRQPKPPSKPLGKAFCPV